MLAATTTTPTAIAVVGGIDNNQLCGRGRAATVTAVETEAATVMMTTTITTTRMTMAACRPSAVNDNTDKINYSMRQWKGGNGKAMATEMAMVTTTETAMEMATEMATSATTTTSMMTSTTMGG